MTQQNQEIIEQYYTVKECEKLLGVTRSTLDRFSLAGKIQKVKFGGRTLFTASSINAFLRPNGIERPQSLRERK